MIVLFALFQSSTILVAIFYSSSVCHRNRSDGVDKKNIENEALSGTDLSTTSAQCKRQTNKRCTRRYGHDRSVRSNTNVAHHFQLYIMPHVLLLDLTFVSPHDESGGPIGRRTTSHRHAWYICRFVLERVGKEVLSLLAF
jgi:hypothetical protein